MTCIFGLSSVHLCYASGFFIYETFSMWIPPLLPFSYVCNVEGLYFLSVTFITITL